MARTEPRGWRWTTWPRRTLWPTRDGWWCLAAAIGLGFAAINTGNNLLHLLVSMLLGLIIVSGALSEQSMRGLRFAAVRPDEVHAGRPAIFGLRVVNGKRWRASYSVSIEVLEPAARGAHVFLARLPPRADTLVTWEVAPLARGRHAFPRLRVSTRFPFGLFLKTGRVAIDAEVIVYPAIRALGPDERPALGDLGSNARRRGRGSGLHNLREYRAGDEPRMIHWRSSAKTGVLVVRELEADRDVDARIVLHGTGAVRERLEAGLSEAASLAVHLLDAGARVELAGPGVHVPLGCGVEQRRRVLTALALYEPRPDAPAPPVASARVREIAVSIG